MDAVDRKLINLLQEGLPLEKNPYGILAAVIGVSREEVLRRIETLIAEGYIRRLGGVFDTRSMGYESLLVGLRVPDEIFREVADYVNSFSGVTHNYRRKGFLNMWFTLSAQSEDEMKAVIEELRSRFGLRRVHPFPKLRSFKLRVFFDMERR